MKKLLALLCLCALLLSGCATPEAEDPSPLELTVLAAADDLLTEYTHLHRANIPGEEGEFSTQVLLPLMQVRNIYIYRMQEEEEQMFFSLTRTSTDSAVLLTTPFTAGTVKIRYQDRDGRWFVCHLYCREGEEPFLQKPQEAPYTPIEDVSLVLNTEMQPLTCKMLCNRVIQSDPYEIVQVDQALHLFDGQTATILYLHSLSDDFKLANITYACLVDADQIYLLFSAPTSYTLMQLDASQQKVVSFKTFDGDTPTLACRNGDALYLGFMRGEVYRILHLSLSTFESSGQMSVNMADHSLQSIAGMRSTESGVVTLEALGPDTGHTIVLEVAFDDRSVASSTAR